MATHSDLKIMGTSNSVSLSFGLARNDRNGRDSQKAEEMRRFPGRTDLRSCVCGWNGRGRREEVKTKKTKKQKRACRSAEDLKIGVHQRDLDQGNHREAPVGTLGLFLRQRLRLCTHPSPTFQLLKVIPALRPTLPIIVLTSAPGHSPTSCILLDATSTPTSAVNTLPFPQGGR